MANPVQTGSRQPFGLPDEFPDHLLVGAPAQDDLVVLDLHSSEPLPELEARQGTTAPPAATEPVVPLLQSQPGTAGIWLDGDVLMCACPDCHAPMSIRLWLMVADCWHCGTSI